MVETDAIERYRRNRQDEVDSAAVLGANDGLVSNLSLMLGVAGAALDSTAILVTGLAGLLAGAGSMAMGEWLSVQSSRERYQRQIDVEAAELAEVPAEEERERPSSIGRRASPKPRPMPWPRS